MASLLNLLNSLAGGGQVHDYAHAAQVFRTNNFSRSPKYKYLFYVNFVLGADVPSNISAQEVSYLVKSIDLPKFTVDVKDLNQYNRHVYIQDRIKYEPITIKFHDDNANGARQLWIDYYNYYYADGGYVLNDYNYDDRYQPRLHSAWGLDNGSLTPFFSSVEIYSMYGGQSNKITLMSPVITSFSHDNHDYSEAQGLMETTMQLRYNGVTYEEGYTGSIPGFSESPYYDNTLSGLTGSLGQTNYIDPTTGQLVPMGSGFINPVAQNNATSGYYGFADQGSLYNPDYSQGLTQTEIDNIIANNQTNVLNSSGFVFPDANVSSPIISQNNSDSQVITNPDAINGFSNVDNINASPSGANPYTDGSYQSTLYSKGYTTDQINSASTFVDSVPQSTLQSYNFTNPISAQTLIAQQYIDNPDSLNSIGTVNYGQPNAVAPTLNFNNPNNPPSALYNSDSWQTQLSSQGFSQSDISSAETHLSQLNVAPGTDLASVAKSYIQYNSTTTA